MTGQYKGKGGGKVPGGLQKDGDQERGSTMKPNVVYAI